MGLAIAGCGAQATSPAGSPAGSPATSASTGASAATPIEPEEVDIALNFVIDATYAPILYGIEQGIFEEEGVILEVGNLVEAGGSARAIELLNIEEVDFSFSDVLVYMADRIENDSPNMGVLVWMDVPTIGLGTLDQPITDIAQLGGMSIAASPFSALRYTLPILLRDHGVDPDSVSLELSETPIQLLFEGDVDAAALGIAGNLEPATREAEQQGFTLHFLDLADYGMFSYSKTLFVRTELIDTNPDLVARVVAALKRSMDESFEADDDAVADVLLAAAPLISREEALAEWQAFKAAVENPGPFEATAVAEQLRYVVEGLDLPTDLEAEDFFTNEFVPD
jgi:NitT/TauT family transport system substrate-binding protein